MKGFASRVSSILIAAAALLIMLPAVAFGASFPIDVNEQNFPDRTWREHVNASYAGGDGILTQSEAEAVTKIQISGLGAADLTGLEFFSNLEELDCSNNLIGSLDASGLPNLKLLYCQVNRNLSEINVSGLNNLQTLLCFSTKISSLDVSGLSNLVTLTCNLNPSMTYLNIEGTDSLKHPNFYENSLLDVVGVPSNASYVGYSGAEQSRTVLLVGDPSGGYMSEEVYSFEEGHRIGSLAEGVSFEADGRFHMKDLIDSSPFVTTLGDSGLTLSGTLHFSAVHYTVTFLDWDGSEIDTQSVPSGGSATAPADPSRDGHAFIGWDKDFSNIAGDLTVTALYEAASKPEPEPEPLPSPNTDTEPGTLAKTGDDLQAAPIAAGCALLAGAAVFALYRRFIR